MLNTIDLWRAVMSDESKVRDVIDAVEGVVKAVPIYQDALQPAAQEAGKALQTVAKAVHIALAPVSALVWGYDQMKEFVSTKVAERLKDVPPEDIITPKPNVAGPALEALRYTGYEPSLSELYANLLAASMNKNTEFSAHPAFVEIIKQLTPDEAKLIALFAKNIAMPLISVQREDSLSQNGLRGGHYILVNYSHLGQMAKCEIPLMSPAYINNICRLGLAEIPAYCEYTAPGVYDSLESDPEIQGLIAKINADPNHQARVTRSVVMVTELGKQFIQVCIKNVR